MIPCHRWKPQITKAEAIKLLPLGSCKVCIFFRRCFPKTRRSPFCSRCQTFYAANMTYDYFGVSLLTPMPGRVNHYHPLPAKLFKEI